MSDSIKVLLIEDDPDDFLLTRDLLERIPHQAFEIDWMQTYESGLEALCRGEHDVCLVDYRLGECDGLRLIEHATSFGRRAPLIMLTGAGSRGTDIAAMRAGADDFLVKGSIDAALLDRSIRYAIERRTLEERLVETQKLESLGVLAGGIAHDFNNLLVGILGNASLALAELPEDSPARATVEQIEVAGQRAAGLARQMLAYSGKGRFVVEPVDVPALVEETGRLVSAGVEAPIEISYTFEHAVPPIEADANQLRQLTMNLLMNAAEALGTAGGTIWVRLDVVDGVPRDGYRFGEDLPPGPYVRLEVEDRGAGMDRETVTRIFEPFFSTKFTGRGLGLAAVLGIVRGHRGAIRVTSEPGAGSVFTLVFPRSARAVVTPLPAAVPAPVAPATVLIADDEPFVREVAARMLESAGFTVLLAGDGVEALKVASERGHELGAILLDLMMPGLSGAEVIERLKEIAADVPVVLSSGYNAQELSQRFVDSGLAGFVQKPYRREDLLDRISTAVGRGAA